MLAESSEADALVDRLVSIAAANPLVFINVVAKLSNIAALLAKKLDNDPITGAIAALCLTLPAIKESDAEDLEQGLSMVVNMCGQCADKSGCTCAAHLKLFGAARALRECLLTTDVDDKVLAQVRKIVQ